MADTAPLVVRRVTYISMLFAYLEIMQYFTQGNSIFIYITEAIARTFQFMQKPQGVAMFISKGNYIAKYCGMLQKLII